MRLTGPDATHIFDGLNAFPTHISHIQLGRTPRATQTWTPTEGTDDLFKLALEWLRVDRELRRVKEKEKGRVRGPKSDVSLGRVAAMGAPKGQKDPVRQELTR